MHYYCLVMHQQLLLVIYLLVIENECMATRSDAAIQDATNRRLRLRRWIDDHFGGSQAAFVARHGLNQGEISALLKDKSFGGVKARNLEASTGMPERYLDSRDEAAATPVSIPLSRREVLPDGYVRLEHLSPTPSMGPGTSLAEPMHVVRHLDVLESWVRQKVGSVDYDRIKILTGCGQSMLPTIHDQDLVFVDINQRTIDVPGIYVVDVYGRFLLKRALILSDGTLILKSDNVEEFPDEERIDLLKAADTVTVAGRVKAWWTLRHG